MINNGYNIDEFEHLLAELNNDETDVLNREIR
jgi:hypothetical protein